MGWLLPQHRVMLRGQPLPNESESWAGDRCLLAHHSADRRLYWLLAAGAVVPERKVAR